MIEAEGAARREGVRIAIPGLLGLVACTPIYDAQYDDRRRELEAFREEFQPAKNVVELVESGGERVFWVDKIPPGSQIQMHSMDPANPSSQVDYDFEAGNGFEEFHFGSQLVVDCSFGSIEAYLTTSSSDMVIGTLGQGGVENCALDGNTIYFLKTDVIEKWTPVPGTTPMPSPFVDLVAAGLQDGATAFGVVGTLVVVADGDGDLFTIDTSITPHQAVYLDNGDHKLGGNLFLDKDSVVFDTINPRGIRYIDLVDRTDESFDDLVDDGGYHINFKHGDIQAPVESEFVIHERHVIYRGQRGIFAYGLDTGNVIDLLLEEGEGIDRVVAYRNPTVTKGGFLFVRSSDGFSGEGPVYKVDLAGRLR